MTDATNLRARTWASTLSVMCERTTQRGETYQGDDSTIKASVVADNQPINNEQGTETKRERVAKAWRLRSSVIIAKR